jgi:hypothetical protein
MPEYASTVQRSAVVVIKNERGKPLQIIESEGAFWTFDADGKIDQALRNSAAEALDLGPVPNNSGGKVVNLLRSLKRREFREQNRWELTKEHLDWISADLWPSEDIWPQANISIASGTEPKRPPLTYEARRALVEIETKISMVHLELDRLSEAALKGLAFEAREKIESVSDLWTGVAAECDHLRELKARRRTGRGAWYAVIEAERPDASDHDVMHIDEIAYEKCNGRKAAAVAARRLLKEHADSVDETKMIRSALYSELEWEPLKER